MPALPVAVTSNSKLRSSPVSQSSTNWVAFADSPNSTPPESDWNDTVASVTFSPVLFITTVRLPSSPDWTSVLVETTLKSSSCSSMSTVAVSASLRSGSPSES